MKWEQPEPGADVDQGTAAIRTKDGQAIMELMSLKVEAGRIEMRGKTFGTMPQIMYVEPTALWTMFRMVSPSLVLRLPGLLFAGWRASRPRKAGG